VALVFLDLREELRADELRESDLDTSTGRPSLFPLRSKPTFFPPPTLRRKLPSSCFLWRELEDIWEPLADPLFDPLADPLAEPFADPFTDPFLELATEDLAEDFLALLTLYEEALSYALSF
jgi:hypothetical protein